MNLPQYVKIRNRKQDKGSFVLLHGTEEVCNINRERFSSEVFAIIEILKSSGLSCLFCGGRFLSDVASMVIYLMQFHKLPDLQSL